MISREDVNALQNIGRKAGMNVPTQDETAFSRRLGTVVQVYDDGRLDVNMNSVDKPSVQYGLRMTTACRGVAVNDVVVVDVFAHVPLVTGVIAHDSSHYVKLLWSGNLRYGESAVVNGLPDYNAFVFCFGANQDSVVYTFRTGSYISGVGGYADTNGAFRIQSARASASGTTLTLLDDGGLSIWGASWEYTSFDRGVNLTAVYGLL